MKSSGGLLPTQRRVFAVAALVVGVLALLLPAVGAPARPPGRFDRAGLDGSESATMQPVDVGVRVALVSVVPGSPDRQAWAIGRSSAKLAGWAGATAGSQIVFLHYRSGEGWRLNGPPIDAGKPVNPGLAALSIAAGGEGWAVGESGALWHLQNGIWSSAPTVTPHQLSSVSVLGFDTGVTGFAAGDGPTILRLAGGKWAVDPISVPQGQTWQINAISTVSSDEAWAAGFSARGTLILHRTAAGWQRVLTGQPLFDEESRPRNEGSTVIASTQAASVAVNATGAWVGGTIVPAASTATASDPAGDATRPFTVHIDGAGATSYCPDQYTSGSSGSAATSICDKPFPLSGFGISTLQTIGNEVMAGGLGLFHFHSGSWFREPDPLSAISSLSFASRTEGWIASTGDTVGAATSGSSIATLGHWTNSPDEGHVARWPQPINDPSEGITQPMESVAVAPDHSGRAIAVGGAGAVIVHKPGSGWTSFPPLSANTFHAVAWPANIAWIVGAHGSIYSFDGTSVAQDRSSETVSTASLFGVAFASPNQGYAVGANGTILRFGHAGWTEDPVSRKIVDVDLYSIAVAGQDFIAAGSDGTVLIERNGTWSVVRGLEPLIRRGLSSAAQLPALYAVSGLSDGSAFIGGELSTLIRRDGANGAWRVDSDAQRVPPEGTILSLAVSRRSDGYRILAGMTYSPLKFSGDVPAVVSGFLLEGKASGWRDLAYSTRTSVYPTFDGATPVEPPYGIASDGIDGGDAAWVAAGSGAGSDDGAGNPIAFPTSAIFRIDLSGDPAPLGNTTTPDLPTGTGLVSFAYFGESACGRTLCSVSMGSNTKADVIALQIRSEINAMSKLPGGPRFVVFGGDMRRTGIPEELGEFKRYLDGFRIPVFAALGGQDLFAGLQGAATTPAGLQQNLAINPDARFYQSLYGDRPEPWGNASALSEFRSVDAGSASGARSHYAFDYAPNGSSKLRVVVLDDSAQGRLTNPSLQNPPEDQHAFLQSALSSAQTPAVLVMNRPAGDPLDLTRPRDSEVDSIQSAGAQLGVSAVLTSFYRENGVQLVDLQTLGVQGLTGTVPVYVFGGGGSPLQDGPGTPPAPPEPSLGKYHSWQLVSVDASKKINARLNQFKTSVRSFPVVDSVSMTPLDGTEISAGGTLRFFGAGHAPVGGGSGDPLQPKASEVPFTFATRGVCPPVPSDRNNPKCYTTGPVGPTYYFQSEDNKIGYFVRPSVLDPRLPQLDQKGDPIPDPDSGLFCGIGAGSTYVDLVSGFHQARVLVHVSGGSGACVKQPVIENKKIHHVVVTPTYTPSHNVVTHAPHVFFHHIQVPEQIAFAAPPPISVVAPAPPVAGGYSKREEHEHAPQDSSQKFTALVPGRRRGLELPMTQLLGGALFVAWMGSLGVIAARRRPVPATVRRFQGGDR